MSNAFQKVGMFFAAFSLMASAVNANVTGYVKDVYNVGIGGASVSLLSSGATATTDANGYFSIMAGNAEIAGIKNSVSAPSFEGGLLHYSVTKPALVQVSTYGMLGQKIFRSDRQMMNAGIHSINAIPENANPGVYLIKIDVGNSEYTYKINYKGVNHNYASVEKVGLRKALALADSLVIQYDGTTLVDKVPVLDDDDSVGDVVITRKTVSGAAKAGASVNVTLLGSLGENIALTATAVADKYEVSSDWMLYKGNRRWNISASAVGAVTATQANVGDNALNITLNLMESTTPDVSSFSVISSSSSTAIPSSSSSVIPSSSSSVIPNSSSSVIPSVVEGSSSSVKSSSSSAKSSSSSVVFSSSVAQITMASLATSNPEIYKFVNWQWEYRLSSKGIVSGSNGTYDDYRTENSTGLSFEHIINGKGTLKYCVVWEKKSALSKTTRDQIRQMLVDITHAWTQYLTGFEGWPYDNVNVVATGWAVYDVGYIEDKQSDENVYTSTKTDGMVGEYYTLNFGGNVQPYCPDGTYDEIFQIVDGYTEYSADMWGFAGGGLWVAAGHVESMLGVGIPHIVAHESGHNFGLPDYYETWDFPDDNYSSPKSGDASDGGIIANANYSGVARSMVMNSGSSSTVTEYDYWLLRKFWYETKHKYGY